MVLNEGVSKAAAAWMHRLFYWFLFLRAPEVVVSAQVSSQQREAPASCALVLLTELWHFCHSEQWHGRAVVSGTTPGLFVFFAALSDQDLVIPIRFMHLVLSLRHLLNKAFTALDLQGWTRGELSIDHRNDLNYHRNALNHWAVCVMGWSVDEWFVHRWRTLLNALFLLSVCFKVWEALAARVFPIPAVTTSPLKTVRRQRCWTTSLSVLTGLE